VDGCGPAAIVAWAGLALADCAIQICGGGNRASRGPAPQHAGLQGDYLCALDSCQHTFYSYFVMLTSRWNARQRAAVKERATPGGRTRPRTGAGAAEGSRRAEGQRARRRPDWRFAENWTPSSQGGPRRFSFRHCQSRSWPSATDAGAEPPLRTETSATGNVVARPGEHAPMVNAATPSPLRPRRRARPWT